MTKGPRQVVPKKVSESWFTLHVEEKRVGHAHLFWEPHGDRTAWLLSEQRMTLPGGAGVMDVRVEARLALEGGWPVLRWCRSKGRQGGEVVEMITSGGKEKPGPQTRVLPEMPDLLLRELVPLVAAAAPAAPGEVLRAAVLRVDEARVVPGYTLQCRGPEEVDAGGERFATTRYELMRKQERVEDGARTEGAQLEREGEREATYWIDANRRIRKADLAGVVALMTTKAAATGEAPA